MSRGPGRTLQEEIQEEFLHGKGGQGWEGAAQGTLRNSVALRALVWLIRWCLIRGWTRFWTFFQPKLFHSVFHGSHWTRSGHPQLLQVPRAGSHTPSPPPLHILAANHGAFPSPLPFPWTFTCWLCKSTATPAQSSLCKLH